MSQTKKAYKKPELKEVKLKLEEQVLTACRSARNSNVNFRSSRSVCGNCKNAYQPS